MSIHLVMHGDIVIVETPGGTISDKALGELETAIRRQVAAGCKKILVDLGKTSFMNSRGIGSLAGLQANAFRNGAALYLCNVDHRIHNVLVILWLTRVLNVLGTREEALAFLTSLDLDLEVDALHLHSARVEKLSTTLAYMWTNHGAAATVQQHTPVAGGTAMIRVRRATGGSSWTWPTTAARSSSSCRRSSSSAGRRHRNESGYFKSSSLRVNACAATCSR